MIYALRSRAKENIESRCDSVKINFGCSIACNCLCAVVYLFGLIGVFYFLCVCVVMFSV